MADAREQEVWSNHARKDHFRIEPYTDSPRIDNLIKRMEIKPLIVMDIGCGSGLWRPVFDNTIYIGVEQNKDMLDAALTHFPDCMCYQEPRVPGVGDDILSMVPYKNTFFVKHNARNDFIKLFETKKTYRYGVDFISPDLVFFSAVLQHNRESDKIEIFNNLKEFIVPGNYLMFTENTFTETNFNPPFLRFEEGQTDGWSYTRKGWKEFVSKFGFELIENEPFNFYLFRRSTGKD